MPAGTPVPGGFEPGSVTFVSQETGFVIGIDSACAAGSCVAVARTTDAGASWVAIPAPIAGFVNRYSSSSTAPAVSEVRFADELDGWIFGPSLFATHDGGATWQQVKVSGSVIALETSGGYVDAVVSPCSAGQECSGALHLMQAPVSGGVFTTVLSGPVVSSSGAVGLALSLHSPAGFARLGVTDAPGLADLYATGNLASTSSWHAFADPCASSAGTGLDDFVAPNATDLYSLCSGSGAAGSVQKFVVKTTNGVSHVVGSPPAGGDPEALAATASGTLVVSAASGASWLYRSTDGGATWSTVETENDGGIGFNDLGFTTATQGVVIHGVPGPPANATSELLMTTDGGATWTATPIT
ncbi:MAG TPA: sialidase family protein [Acidimicrobiales bacterium]|nr:sialidase family protein [Acidimicrobiales bacterium]